MTKGKTSLPITELLQQHYPLLFQGDPRSTGAALAEIADVLGSILAFVKVMYDDEAYMAAAKMVISRMVKIQDGDGVIQCTEELATTMHSPSNTRQ